MYQAIYDPVRPAFNSANIQAVVGEMKQLGFEGESFAPNLMVFRGGDRYVAYQLSESDVAVRLGMGVYDPDQASINSMRLDEMIGFLYGSLKRGCHPIDDAGIEDCLAKAAKDLKEFAHEFLRGDFRPFLRVLSMKKKEEMEAAKQRESLTNSIYLA